MSNAALHSRRLRWIKAEGHTAINIGRREFIGALGSVVVGLWLAQLAPTATIAVAGPRSVGLPHLSSNVDLVGKIRHMMRHID